MKIIIVGAGRVGESVAESLVSEQNDITLVDTDPVRLSYLQDRLDLQTLVGNATQPSVLKLAGADDADLLLAVTGLDETNLAICQIAARLHNVPTRIARVRSELQDMAEFCESAFGVHHMICPEQTVTETILKLIQFPEALQVLEFAEGRVSLIAVRAYEDGPLVQHPLRDLKQHLPNLDSRCVAIFRRGVSIVPDGDTRIELGDEAFFLAATEHIRPIMSEMRRMDKPVKRVMIAGGGKIGLRLARMLGNAYQVKLIEPNKKRCEYLATETASSTLVLQGDATDEDLLSDEHVEEMDLFVAVTADDENNIMSSLLAKRMGARRTIALINRKAYAELMEGSRVDIAIVPSQASIGDLLTHVRRGDIAAVHSLRRGAAEALETVAHGDSKSSKVVGRRIEQLDLPKGARIGAIVGLRDGVSQVIMAHHDVVIESGDHVIVFMENKASLPKLEKLFQVSAGFF
jgi:trk system potassium uptake protein